MTTSEGGLTGHPIPPRNQSANPRFFETKTNRDRFVLIFTTLAGTDCGAPRARSTLRGMNGRSERMKKPASFTEAFEILDRAIDDIDEPRLRSLIDDEIRLGRRRAGDAFERIERSVKEHPLLYIGGAAATAAAIGFLISRRAEVNV
jgi:hypothetical protein